MACSTLLKAVRSWKEGSEFFLPCLGSSAVSHFGTERHHTTPAPPESNSESSRVFVAIVSRDLACFVLTQLYSFLTSGSEPGALAPAFGPQEPLAFVFLVQHKPLLGCCRRACGTLQDSSSCCSVDTLRTQSRHHRTDSSSLGPGPGKGLWA